MKNNVKTIYFGLYMTLGDIICSTALIRTIKQKYPDADITYAVGKDYVDVLSGNPDIKFVFPCNNHWEIILGSQAKKYDKVFLPLMKNQIHTIWHQEFPWCVDNGDKHNLVDMYAYKCQDDLVVADRKTYIYPTDRHWEIFLSKVPEKAQKLFKEDKYITIHTTSRNESKDWSYENFSSLVNKIHEKYGDRIKIIQIGGDKDRPLPSPAIAVLGTPLLMTASIIKRSLLHIDIDSGPSFIADSLDIPTICIMGATWSQTSGPIGPNVEFIEPNRHCLDKIHTPCHTHCLFKNPCINSISPDVVMGKVSEKLENKLNENK